MKGVDEKGYTGSMYVVPLRTSKQYTNIRYFLDKNLHAGGRAAFWRDPFRRPILDPSPPNATDAWSQEPTLNPKPLPARSGSAETVDGWGLSFPLEPGRLMAAAL